MAVYKCKMCGGTLEIAEGMTVSECEYCGTKQTLPKAQDDATANLFNRANNLRYKSEFDKAQALYEKLVMNYPDDSESYWGLVLCKYGIEYVEDPATLKKIPTCHRTQLEPVQTDPDYLAALEHADFMQRAVYEQEAAEIDRLQKDILAIAQNEAPFDVFICYTHALIYTISSHDYTAYRGGFFGDGVLFIPLPHHAGTSDCLEIKIDEFDNWFNRYCEGYKSTRFGKRLSRIHWRL